MKTQLLEDIGQSAPSSLTPSIKTGLPKAEKREQPANPRPAPGVWRTKPAAEPPPVATGPDPTPAALDLDSVFEEIAALEARYRPPGEQPAPVAAPDGPAPRPPLADAPPHPLTDMGEPTLVRDPADSATVPRDPVFDFTAPMPPPAAAPFTPAPHWPTRSRQRLLLGAAGLLSAALLAGGGWWLYQERNDAGSLALIATQANQRDAAPGAGTRVAAAAPPARSGPAPAVPPLVMLEPGKPAAARAEPPPPPVRETAEPGTASAPQPVAEQEAAPAPPKPASRARRKQSQVAAAPARGTKEREPARQFAPASTVQAARPSAGEGEMTALLRACREHGYHATQCIKRGCSLTQYGFACRGR